MKVGVRLESGIYNPVYLLEYKFSIDLFLLRLNFLPLKTIIKTLYMSMREDNCFLFSHLGRLICYLLLQGLI